jgi:hypothetical protein
MHGIHGPVSLGPGSSRIPSQSPFPFWARVGFRASHRFRSGLEWDFEPVTGSVAGGRSGAENLEKAFETLGWSVVAAEPESAESGS